MQTRMTKRKARRDRHRFRQQQPAPQPQFTINIDMRHFTEKIDALTKALAAAAPAIAEAGRQMSERFAQMGERLTATEIQHRDRIIPLSNQAIAHINSLSSALHEQAIAELQMLTGLPADVCRDRLDRFCEQHSSSYQDPYRTLRQWLQEGVYDLDRLEPIRDRPVAPVLQSSINWPASAAEMRENLYRDMQRIRAAEVFGVYGDRPWSDFVASFWEPPLNQPAILGLPEPQTTPPSHAAVCKTIAPCTGCRYFCGDISGGRMLVCAVHPHGVEGDSCPDYEAGDRCKSQAETPRTSQFHYPTTAWRPFEP